MKNIIAKYLAHHSEPEAQLADCFTSKAYDCSVTIPIYAENDFIDECLAAIEGAAVYCHKTALAILILNARPSSPEWAHRDNENLMRRLLQLRLLSPFQSAYHLEYSSCLDLLILDKTLFPEKQGVGLARKIGCDLQLALREKGVIRSDYLYTTDADARVPRDYFDMVNPREKKGLGPQEGAAILFDFEHVTSPHSPLSRYDHYLRSYSNGLRDSGSPYAFHALGSTIAVHAKSYATVRGFPKRMAGEDFYILNKLAKVGTLYLDSRRIRLVERASTRTPFGTGAAIEKMATHPNSYLPYPQESFDLLKNLLESFKEWAEKDTPLSHSLKHLGTLQYLASTGLSDALNTIIHSRRSPKDRYRHLMTWFDALSTLKFIRWVPCNFG